ncbi:DUF3102 domain-containing protein [Enterococcus gallinarum]|uniref:DUF3102 domain-containing protein n=1 Tax=Enterococcus gallinarum TaxID=1353 RepID=A0AAE4KX08_ENTGA|nr:DUF3102 domain-containing protein [Enterococcus gallinarum]MDT2687116.1 DUF3102 domain-containing protein [Enterococcus gallinarum]MDT2689736.1 DUF3102 domain-containing protein [Enterococcus gallinarum]
MNEIQLSKDINILTAEINSYKQLAGQSIWEIGRRLNYVKENDLAHGEFSKWVSEIGIQEREAQRFMKIANELPNATTWSALGTRALYLIATLPEEERTKEHVTEKGETKTPDEMTVRELQELKKQLKAKDEQIAMQAKMIDDLSEQEPEIIEKEVVVEKIPDDYSFFKGNYEVTKSNYEFYKSQNEDLRNEIKNLEERIKQESSSEQETKLLQEKITALESTRFEMHEKEKSYKRVTNLSLEIENILDNHACLKYSKDFKNLSLDRQAFLELEDSIERLEQWISEIKSELPNKNIIEGELLK